MTSTSGKRVDRASRVVAASPSAIYQAFVDPAALSIWLPPAGMTMLIENFEAREGGRYRMVLFYPEAGSGKSSADSDIVEGCFVTLVPDERVVQEVDFVSDDPAFSSTMRMTWSLSPQAEGTLVAIACEDVPAGIRPEDHHAGLNSSLDNLEAYFEDRPS